MKNPEVAQSLTPNVPIDVILQKFGCVMVLSHKEPPELISLYEAVQRCLPLASILVNANNNGALNEFIKSQQPEKPSN